MAEQKLTLSADSSLVGAVEIKSTYDNLRSDAKKLVVLAAYREVQQSSGEAVDPDHHALDGSCLGSTDATYYNTPCVISLQDNTFTIQAREKEVLTVRMEDVNVASTLPRDPCRLILVASPQKHAFLPHTGATTIAVVTTVFSIHSLEDILGRMVTLNPTIGEINLCQPNRPPAKPLRASQRKVSQEDNTLSQQEQDDDQPPKLSRKSSKKPPSSPKDNKNLLIPGGSGGSHSIACDVKVSGHYPLRGELSGKLRAQDCKSGYYDMVPLGPPKKVDEAERETEQTTDS